VHWWQPLPLLRWALTSLLQQLLVLTAAPKPAVPVLLLLLLLCWQLLRLHGWRVREKPRQQTP
jgi:hypothetical protein